VSTTTTILAFDDDGMIDGQRSAAIHELCERGEGWELKDANEEDWTCVTKRNALNDRQTARRKVRLFHRDCAVVFKCFIRSR